ncbi:phenylalanine--tRNA ligase subunit alpha [Candidatus Dependentiae bacterium]|nr:phenylalanine--tRNA ligase subunit alpha [Candidatus Dependentiae bacterium]
MDDLKQKITNIKKEFEEQINYATEEKHLENIRIAFLGRKGKITSLIASFKMLPVEQKREWGPLLQELKQFCQSLYTKKQVSLKQATGSSQQKKKLHFDVTAYKPNQQYGSLHIYTHLTQKLEDIFISMGYKRADGTEIETDYYNFSALNIPENHPARDMHDTFWLTIPGMLMRTHTSTIQIHAMEQQELPLALFAPGRAYRNEATDASHNFMFMQVEGLFVDKNVSMAHLLGTAQAFLQNIFGKNDLNIRVRPGYFPFVEPGVEIDCSCPFCSNGCSVCKHTTWIELLGAGLVHPNVLDSCGIDSSIYSGFAFGMGLERLAMILYRINDIRLFHSNSLNFLTQF